MAAAFNIESTTGQLKTKAALDYETKSAYSVVVTVSDGTLTDTIIVPINVTDLEEVLANTAPVFTDGASTTRTIAEHTAAGVNIGTAIAATDADHDVLTYTLRGTRCGGVQHRVHDRSVKNQGGTGLRNEVCLFGGCHRLRW